MGAFLLDLDLHAIGNVLLAVGGCLLGALLFLFVILALTSVPQSPTIKLAKLQGVAMEHWGITQPIKARWASTITITGDPYLVGKTIHGAHERKTAYHQIYLLEGLTKVAALIVLAHELQHCKQAEIAGLKGWKARCEKERKLPYDERPMEIEAVGSEQDWRKLDNGVLV